MKNDLQERLIALVASFCLLDPSSVSEDTLTDDIGLDSLSLTQIITSIEVEFALDLEEEDLAKLLEARVIGDFADVLVFARNRACGDAPKEASEQE